MSSLWFFEKSTPFLPSSVQQHEVQRDSIPHPADSLSLLYGFNTKGLQIVEGRIKRDQRFIDLLKGYRIPTAVRQQINLLPREVFDFRKVRRRKKYTLLAYSSTPPNLPRVKAIIYEPSLINYVVFHMEDSFFVEECRREVISVEKNVSGVIKSSLYDAIKELNISHQLTNRFVDIFAWQIDFQHLQKGDLFKLIYEDRTVDGNSVGIGNIKAVYFDHSGDGYCAFPFNQDGNLDYFDDEGNSLEKTLLKYPIEFTRISSRYTRRRFHPVSRIFKSHLGTDFAAPIGTPIRSVGDGVVTEARYKRYNGNYVKIRHNSDYTTQYLHMSKIASGIRKGVRVRRGQKIGFVGKTGLATGPHLCYRFWKNNVQVDALKVELPSSDPLEQKYWPVFSQLAEKMTTRLDSISVPGG